MKARFFEVFWSKSKGLRMNFDTQPLINRVSHRYREYFSPKKFFIADLATISLLEITAVSPTSTVNFVYT